MGRAVGALVAVAAAVGITVAVGAEVTVVAAVGEAVGVTGVALGSGVEVAVGKAVVVSIVGVAVASGVEVAAAAVAAPVGVAVNPGVGLGFGVFVARLPPVPGKAGPGVGVNPRSWMGTFSIPNRRGAGTSGGCKRAYDGSCAGCGASCTSSPIPNTTAASATAKRAAQFSSTAGLAGAAPRSSPAGAPRLNRLYAGAAR